MIRIVIQSRLSSSRLPGKALLPVGGVPSVVLSALRAGGREQVVVATSLDASDDPLAETLEKYGIRTVRGPLDDVLARYTQAALDLRDEDWIVRLTGDNVFPDADFVYRLMEAAQRTGEDYFGTATHAAGLPYGLSAEAFTVGALRKADAQAVSAHDREHVTPWLQRRGEHHPKVFHPLSENGEHLRCTLDTFEDYLRLHQVFKGVAEPVAIAWQDLVLRLHMVQADDSPGQDQLSLGEEESRRPDFVLGTAQLGMDYGIANQTGMPDERAAERLVKAALSSGIQVFDTARAYGLSEARLGRALHQDGTGQSRVVTKLDPLADLDPRADATTVRLAVDASVFHSLTNLSRDAVDFLLLHRWSHRHNWNETIWTRLLELRALGYIKNLGCSVSTPAEAVEALGDKDVRLVQLPFNILDHRWRNAGIDTLAAGRPDCMIHVRSIFLQGLLVNGAEYWPDLPGVSPVEWSQRLDEMVTLLQRISRHDLCLAYVRAQPWVDGIVIGCETAEQVRENVALFEKPPLSPDLCRVVEDHLMGAPENLLNPSSWSQG